MKRERIERTEIQDREGLRKKVRMFYDIQRLRLQTGGRGMPKADGAEIQLHEHDVEVLDLRADELGAAEERCLKDVEDHLRDSDLYAMLRKDERFKGIGPTLWGVILSEFDIRREDNASKMWSFAGLAPVPARRCKACHGVVSEKDGAGFVHVRRPAPRKPGEAEPVDGESKAKCPAGALLTEDKTYASARAARPTRGEKLPYNAWLRSKLIGVMGPCLLKANSPMRKFYDDYKHRKQSAGWGMSDGHRHNAAVRYMVKMVLLEVWKLWRGHLGLEIRPPYQEQYLGHVHGEAVAS